jgi:hypothetical protein
MFISKSEKEHLTNDVINLAKLISGLNVSLVQLSLRVDKIEKPTPKVKKSHKKWTMSAEGRANVSAALKARHAKKKLEKQNAASVSA